jgi:cyclopropane-fatty-acyl-phospholipid synthase
MNEEKLAQRIQNQIGDISFNVLLPDGAELRFGKGEPSFTVRIKNDQILPTIVHFDEFRLAEAYINGDIDVEGEMWGFVSCRDSLRDTHPLQYVACRVLPMLRGQLRTNKQAIADHYEYENDFFLSFIGSCRCYSQALFAHDDESLDAAHCRKLDFVVKSCRLKPGDRVLDVGGGWGTFVEYAGRQGIQVTALTLAKQSANYIQELIERLQLPCEVKYGDFYEYQSPTPYDAIVILGVMEHLPNYRAVLEQCQRLLRPGGRIYLDASSYRKKYAKATFISRYVFPGNHRYFCLHDFLSQVAETKFELNCVFNDRHSYYLTCRDWARNLEASREKVVARWGERLYRIFRLYLWGSSHAFFNRSMDAFRVVLERPEELSSVEE